MTARSISVRSARSFSSIDNRPFIAMITDTVCHFCHAFSNRGRHCHQKNYDHGQSDDELAEQATDISEQTSPARAAVVNRLLASDEFTGDRANDRSDKQTDDPEEKSDERANDGAGRSPFGRAEIFRAEIAAQKIERVA